jgi:hypothetical protein
VLADWRSSHAKLEAVERANDAARATARLLAARTRYGVAMLELVRLLRSATPDGVNIDGLAEPETASAGEDIPGGISLRIDGRLDKTRIANPFETLNRYMQDLKAEPFVVEATVSTQELAAGHGGAPGAGGSDPNRLRFNVQLVLDPTKLAAVSTGATAAESGGDK